MSIEFGNEFVKQAMKLKKVNWLIAVVCWAMVPIASVLAQTKPVDPVGQQLLGQWQGTFATGKSAPNPGAMGFMFIPNGKAVMFFAEERLGLIAAAIDYAIDSKPKPMHIDFKPVTFNKPVLSIFELPNSQTLKLQLEKTNPGLPRPKEFKEEGQFRKISDTTIVPLTQLAQAEQSKETEGQWVMKSIAQSALIHKLATQQFPTTLAQLGLDNSETKNYRFQLSTQADQLTIVARAKKAGLRSYIGIVVQRELKEREKQQAVAFSAICQTSRPSLIAPLSPKVAPENTSESVFRPVQCGSGSELIKF